MYIVSTSANIISIASQFLKALPENYPAQMGEGLFVEAKWRKSLVAINIKNCRFSSTICWVSKSSAELGERPLDNENWDKKLCG